MLKTINDVKSPFIVDFTTDFEEFLKSVPLVQSSVKIDVLERLIPTAYMKHHTCRLPSGIIVTAKSRALKDFSELDLIGENWYLYRLNAFTYMQCNLTTGRHLMIRYATEKDIYVER